MAPKTQWQFTPVDHDPFAEENLERQQNLAQQLDLAYGTHPDPAGHEGSVHWAPEGPVAPGGLSAIATNPGYSMPTRIAVGLPLALGQLLQGKANAALAAVKAPGQAFAGTLDPADALPTAMGVATMLNPFGAPEGSLGIMGTRGINPTARSLAETLEHAGASESHIWQTTGLARNVKGMWQREIDDSKSKFYPHSRDLVDDPQHYELGTVYEHPELFKSYPELSTHPVRLLPFGAGGSFDASSMESAFERSTMVHELQHGVDRLDKSPGGGNPEWPEIKFLSKKLNDLQAAKGLPLTDPTHVYNRMAGEVAARNAEARLPLSSTARRQIPPSVTQDVPYDQQFLSDKVEEFAQKHGVDTSWPPKGEAAMPDTSAKIGAGSYPYEWQAEGNVSRAKFKTDSGNDYTVRMDKDPGTGEAHIGYYAGDDQTTALNGSEGRGAIKVLRTFLDAVRNRIVDDPSIKTISFYANKDEASRIKLNRTLIEKLGLKHSETPRGDDIRFEAPIPRPDLTIRGPGGHDQTREALP